MNPSGRRFRRTVWIVAGLHLGLIVAVGVPFATCQKPKKIQPVEIVDLGSLRPGPGSPAPPVQNSNSPGCRTRALDLRSSSRACEGDSEGGCVRTSRGNSTSAKT
jgi:hypothetical protein